MGIIWRKSRKIILTLIKDSISCHWWGDRNAQHHRACQKSFIIQASCRWEYASSAAVSFKEMCMSACMVWALILAVAAIVATGFAYRYKQLANRMKARARIYMRYVPTDKLTGQERVIFEDLKKDIGHFWLSPRKGKVAIFRESHSHGWGKVFHVAQAQVYDVLLRIKTK